MPSIHTKDWWNLIESEIDGMRIVIRARSSLPSDADRQLFPFLVTVTWRYDGNEIGMPPPDVVEKMASLDEAFGGLLDAKGTSIEAASVTGNGVKEWRFYVNDTGDFMNAFNESLIGHPAYPLEFEAFHDPSWDALAEFLPR